MVDDVHVDRHQLALGDQVSDLDRRDGDGSGRVHRVPTGGVVVETRVMEAPSQAAAGARPARTRSRSCVDGASWSDSSVPSEPAGEVVVQARLIVADPGGVAVGPEEDARSI